MIILKDREPIKYITKSWVQENVKNITKRDLELLKIIYENKIVTRDQLITLHPSFSNKRQSVNIINRRLKVLYDNYCIDRVQPTVGIGEGSSQYHITLDRAGAILLGIENFRSIVIYDPSSYPSKRLPMYYKHTIGIVDMKCTITELLREIEGEIVYWGLEEENKIHFKFKKEFTLKPDVIAILRKNQNGFIFFYEHDQGTEFRNIIKAKIEAYAAYRLSNIWINQRWAKIMKVPTFPTLVILTAGDEKRIEWIEKISKSSGINIVVDSIENRYKIISKLILL